MTTLRFDPQLGAIFPSQDAPGTPVRDEAVVERIYATLQSLLAIRRIRAFGSTMVDDLAKLHEIHQRCDEAAAAITADSLMLGAKS